MRRLTVRRDEHGAVIVLMTVLMVVIVGMAALVIDVGALNDEQRQLQNSADAGALGLAQYIGNKGCVSDTGSCLPATLVAEARDLTNGNVRDDMAAYSVTTNYAEKTVTVETRTGNGSTNAILPYQFAQILSGKKGQIVAAAATASWAGLKRATVIRLTLSRCEFIDATRDGTVFDLPTEVLLGVAGDSCPGSPSGANLPGGFGWLDDTDGPDDDCVLTPSTDEIRLGSDPGRDTPRPCTMSNFLDKDVLLALYDEFADKGQGGKAEYGIHGFGEFHLTGYDLPVAGKDGVSCSKKPCLAGKFVRFVPIGELGGPTLGSRVALVS